MMKYNVGMGHTLKTITLLLVLSFNATVFASGSRPPKQDIDVTELSDQQLKGLREREIADYYLSENPHFAKGRAPAAITPVAQADRSFLEENPYALRGKHGVLKSRLTKTGHVKDSGFLTEAKMDKKPSQNAVAKVWDYFRSATSMCPDLAEMSQLVHNTQLAEKCGGKYNKATLEEISKIQPGGGYKYTGKGAQPTNQQITLGGKTISTANRGVSYCSGASYTAFLKMVDRMHPEVFQGMSKKKLQHFAFGHNDNYGMWGAWNNSQNGVYDANRLLPFGIGFRDDGKACPGDYMKWGRTNGRTGGHSAVFLGNKNGRMYFWSSNKTTNGFGVSCERLDQIGRIDMVRVTNPQNLRHIAPFAGLRNDYRSPAWDINSLANANGTYVQAGSGIGAGHN